MIQCLKIRFFNVGFSSYGANHRPGGWHSSSLAADWSCSPRLLIGHAIEERRQGGARDQ